MARTRKVSPEQDLNPEKGKKPTKTTMQSLRALVVLSITDLGKALAKQQDIDGYLLEDLLDDELIDLVKRAKRKLP